MDAFWFSGSVDIITTAGAVDRELIYIERIGEADWNGGAGGSVGFVGELGRGKFGLVETMLEAWVDANLKLCFVIQKIQNLCNQLSGLYLKGPKFFEKVMTILRTAVTLRLTPRKHNDAPQDKPQEPSASFPDYNRRTLTPLNHVF